MTTTATTFYVPTRPYTLTDAINRMAAATGSVGYAMRAADADYNGHAVSVSYNSYRRYYVAEYHWGERVVLARGSLSECVAAALAYYERGARGASVSVTVEAVDAADPCLNDPRLVAGAERDAPRPAWCTWHYDQVNEAIRMNLTGQLLAARTPGEWEAVTAGFDWIRLTVSPHHPWKYALQLRDGRYLLWGGGTETVELTADEVKAAGIRSEKVPGTRSAKIPGAEGPQLRGALGRALCARPLQVAGDAASA